MMDMNFSIFEAIEILEDNGYVVRRLADANVESVLTIIDPSDQHGIWQIGVRLDASVNGRHGAFIEKFPFDLVLDPDNKDFRHSAIPRILAGKLGQYLADALIPGIVEQVREKIDPLVPEKRLSLYEIESLIGRALKQRLVK